MPRARKSQSEPAATDGPSRPKRSRGHPRAGQSPITPEVLEQIAELHLRCRSNREIANTVGVHYLTVGKHIRESVRPAWREAMVADLSTELAKVKHLEKVAWECFYGHEPAETRREVEESLMNATSKTPAAMAMTRRVLRTITRPGAVAYLDVVQWCIDYRAKVAGHYRPDPAARYPATEFRVAGATLDEVDQEMVDRLLILVEQRKRVRGIQSLALTNE